MRKPTNSIQAPMTTNLVSLVDTTSTGALVDTTTALQILDGEVALLSTDLDAADNGQLTALPLGQTAMLVQGTPKSNNTNDIDPWGVSDPAIVKTTNLYKTGVRTISTTDYNSGAYAMAVVTDLPAPVANSEYGIIVELDGVRQQREFGSNTDQPASSVIMPSILPVGPTDYALQTIATKINAQSQLLGRNKRFIVLGLSVDGSGGGTALSALFNDLSALDFQITDGVTYTMQKTTPLIRGLANLVTATTGTASPITGATTVVVMNSTTAGTAASVDALVAIGLDSKLSAYADDLFQVRTDVNINPKDEFESEGTVSKAYSTEEEGSGRVLTIDSENRAQLDIHTKQATPYYEEFSKGYSYLDARKNYGATYVDFVGTEARIDADYTYEKQAVIFWEQVEPTTLNVANIIATAPTGTQPAVVGQLATWSGVTEVTT
jgi:hypothetical protein